MEATHPRNCLLFGDSKQKINRQDMDFFWGGGVSKKRGIRCPNGAWDLWPVFFFGWQTANIVYLL